MPKDCFLTFHAPVCGWEIDSMKSWLTYSIAGIACCAAIAAGCHTLYRDGGAGSGGDASTADPSGPSDSSNDSANGFFVQGGHSIDGGGPPPLPGQQAVEEGEATKSHFRRVQVDPQLEDTAGAKFVRAADMNGDGLMDLVSGHNQSLPVQVHLQRRDGDRIFFETIQIAGTSPIAIMSGLEVADMDGDGRLDIVVLAKATGFFETCGDEIDESGGILDGVALVYFAPSDPNQITDAAAWEGLLIPTSRFRGAEVPSRNFEELVDRPEYQGYTGLAVGDVSGDGQPDILAALNADSCGFTNTGFNQGEGEAVVMMFLNPGVARDSGSWADPIKVQSGNVGAYNKDIALADIDGDGNLDFVLTRPIALGGNVSWYRNPGSDLANAGLWQSRPIGNINPSEEGADVITIGDMDNDGFDDVLVRAGLRGIVQWFRRPTTDTSVQPIFPPNDGPVPPRFDIPWQVFTLQEYSPLRPAGIAIGDLTGDGLNNAAVAVGGALFWYDSAKVTSVFDEWAEDFVLDDTKELGATDDPTSLEFNDTGTQINSLLIVDIDGDGVNDVVATFDRRVNSSVNDDAIYWFRNTLLDE